MNKLFENWRGYLYEQEASWVEDLKKDTWVVLDKTKFKEVINFLKEDMGINGLIGNLGYFGAQRKLKKLYKYLI